MSNYDLAVGMMALLRNGCAIRFERPRQPHQKHVRCFLDYSDGKCVNAVGISSTYAGAIRAMLVDMAYMRLT